MRMLIIKFAGNAVSILIFCFILFGLLNILKESALEISNFIKAKPQDKQRLKRLLLIKAGFLLPWEILNFILTLVFAFWVFHWFTSSIFIISLTALFFKQIISEIPYLVLSALYYLAEKPVSLCRDKFVQDTGIVPSHFPSCIYIPQKAKSIEDVYAGIGQGLRSLRNNSSVKGRLILIYHSDTEDDKLIEEEIRLILQAREEFGSRIFLFARNREAVNPFFLKKPGAYMSDYQILNKGIWHPLTYLGHAFDARRQIAVAPGGGIKNHFPFYLNSPQLENCQFFVFYRRNLFIKEKLLLRKLASPSRDEESQESSQDEIFSDLSVRTKEYLVNKDNSQEHYLVYQGAIFTPEGKILFKANQWKIDAAGEIELSQTKSPLFRNKFFTFLFSSQIELQKKQRLLLDRAANLVDEETGKLWARRRDYRLEKQFDLYKLKEGKFHLIREDIHIEPRYFRGEDYRRSLFDRTVSISSESIEPILKDNLLSPLQAKESMQSGIVGEPYKLHIGKKGEEQEFFIEEPLIQFREKVVGGYLLRQSDGFELDEEGNLTRENSLVEPAENLKKIFLHRDEGDLFLSFEEGKEKYFLRKSETNEKIRAEENEVYFYVRNTWINKSKPSVGGFVVNEKDGFYLDKEGDLRFKGGIFQEIDDPEYVAGKEKIRKLIKEKIFVDYRENSSLKKTIQIAEAGSWYRDKTGNFRRKRHIALRDFVYFRENLEAVVITPSDKKPIFYPPGSYSLGEIYLWQREADDDEIIEGENLVVRKGDLVKEEIIAEEGAYSFNSQGRVITGNKEPLPYGRYLKFPAGEPLKDSSGNFIAADCAIKIVNQTDADAEFQPETIPYINSQLIRNIQQEEEPYLMYQPEIGFANQGQSTFARFNSWAQQMYRFTGRAVFRIFGESSAYGKMTKLMDTYLKNILFKEAIPPLARTHDHWEAMHLKTALVLSYPGLKAKNLIENTPPNFFAFLKRQEGWIGGDLILLEYESYFGLILDWMRAGLCLVSLDFFGMHFWISYARERIKYLKERYDTPSCMAKHLRIWSIKRLSFYPFYYGIWLMLVGTLSLIIPGSLTIKSPGLAWILFWSILSVLIGLPKIIMPLAERFILFRKKAREGIFLIAGVIAAILINHLGLRLFPAHWRWVNAWIIVFYLLYKLFLAKIFKFLFIPYQNPGKRIIRILTPGLVVLLCWLYLPVLISWMENIPSANWIFLFSLDFFPKLAGYLVPTIIILWILPSGKTALRLIKKGVLETVYSSSIFLLNVIYVPLTVLRKIIFMTLHPQRSIPWITSPFVEKLLSQKISLEDCYARLIAAPLVSCLFVILPVISGLVDPSLIFYGWPVFIWSWLFGPVLVWQSGNSGEEKTFSSLEFLSIRDKLIFWKKELLRQGASPSRDEIIEKILAFNLKIGNSLTQRELLSLDLYFLSDIKDSSLQETLQRHLKKELLPERLREYDWQSLNAISRARIILRINKDRSCREYLQREGIDIGLIKASLFLIDFIGSLPSKAADRNEFSKKSKAVQRILKRHKLRKNSRREFKKLLQLFSRAELKSLRKNLSRAGDFASLLEGIPSEFVYLKKAIMELKEIPDLAKLSPGQRKLLFKLLSSRYGLREKAYLKILLLTTKLG